MTKDTQIWLAALSVAWFALSILWIREAKTKNLKQEIFLCFTGGPVWWIFGVCVVVAATFQCFYDWLGKD